MSEPTRADRNDGLLFLAGDIESAAMESICDGGGYSLLGWGSDRFDIEEARLTEAADDAWPVIAVRRSDGARIAIEVTAHVSLLGPLVDDQQPNPASLRRRFHRARLQGKPLDVRDDVPPCVLCGQMLIAGWVDFPTDGGERHADCDHLARMRASHPEWFADTADQLVLDVDGVA